MKETFGLERKHERIFASAADRFVTEMLINYSFFPSLWRYAARVSFSQSHLIMGTENNHFVFHTTQTDSNPAATGVKNKRAFQGLFRIQMFTQSLNHRGECEVCGESVKNMPEESGYLLRPSIFALSIRTEYKHKES